MLPYISVVTPSYNQGRFIERTIQSVLSQDIPGLEYLVVDGGSKDETLEILRKYKNRLNWISERDNGQADAVNKGIKATRGEIIGWLNSDDIYYHGAISEVLTFFEEHPEVDVIYGDADHIDVNDKMIEPYYTEDWNYNRLKEICFISQPAVFFRRRLIERAGLLDDRLRYCMDYEYWLRLGAITPFVRLSKTLAGSRMYEDNKTLRARVGVHKEINDMLKERLSSVPAKWIFSYAHAVVDEMGYNRTAQNENIKYVLALEGVTLVSFLRWNQRIPVSALRTMARWLASVLRN